jgi:Fe2+ or Zn2+ uptake regulation protein
MDMDFVVNEISKRLKDYLATDFQGIRRIVLQAFVKMRSLTADTLHRILSERGFTITLKQVTAMLGVIHSKLGILHAHKNTYDAKYEYSLKEKYENMVTKALGSL